jgi:hypothetical protein
MASIKDLLQAISDKRENRALRTLFEELKPLEGSATWDPGSIADGDEEVKEVTVAGAALGDFVLVSASIDVADLALVAQVTAADTVTCQLLNNTGAAVDLGSLTVRVRVTPLNSVLTA